MSTSGEEVFAYWETTADSRRRRRHRGESAMFEKSIQSWGILIAANELDIFPKPSLSRERSLVNDRRGEVQEIEGTPQEQRL